MLAVHRHSPNTKHDKMGDIINHSNKYKHAAEGIGNPDTDITH